MAERANTLYVLYKSVAKSIPSGDIVLSFMSPEEEYKFATPCCKFLFGRKEMGAVREKARKVYVDLIARIAATPCHDRTLRERLRIKNSGNPWWYHKITEKDAESDETFNMLLQIFTILYIAEREKIDTIIVYGGRKEIARVLASRYKTKAIKCTSSRWRLNFIVALLSRLKYLCKALYFYRAIQCNAFLSPIKPDVVLQGFWDWSIEAKNADGIMDNYFKALPGHLMRKGMQCAWFIWFDPYSKPGTRGRPLTEILQPALGNTQLIFVQKFLRINDIVSAIFDFRPLFRYMRFSRRKEFRALFKEAGCDFFPLMRGNLFYNFCNAGIPHCFLMETAYRRAFAFYKPRLAFSFLDLFLYSRAFYQGAKFGIPQAIKCDMQHASYGREKTFILMDGYRELQGNPDKESMPVPDYFFVMGELCKDILLENGFPTEKIFLTGSARYDHMKILSERTRNGLNRSPGRATLNLLIAPTLNLNLDFEMVQAASIAARDLNIKLYLRSHPFARMEDLAAYKHYCAHIISSQTSLEEDLGNADLVLFTYSTIAEESFLRGIPILQWQAAGFNGSIFRDIGDIPVAYSIESLKEILKRFIDNPDAFKPATEQQAIILNKCFFKADSQASVRIAEKAADIFQALSKENINSKQK